MWLALGIVFGPLVLPLAANALRHDEPDLIERLSLGRAGTGSVDVLVGIDGSAEAEHALRHAVGLLRWRIGRLTLAAVLDYDAATGSVLAEDHEKAHGDLFRTAKATSPQPETIVLSGRPAEALRKYAVEEAYDVIVVGRRVTVRTVSSWEVWHRSSRSGRSPFRSCEEEPTLISYERL
jgi:nucleotide-binding universal stress UspA family protein